MFLQEKALLVHQCGTPMDEITDKNEKPENRWSRGQRGALTVIEPVPKAVEPILNQIFRCSEVEPRID